MAFRVKAVYEYTSSHDDDLAFPVGQIITVTEQEDDDWYGGEYVDDAGVKQEGIFPRNFVEKIEPTAPPRPQRTRTKKDTETAGISATSTEAPELPVAAPVPLPAAATSATKPEEQEEIRLEKVASPEPVSIPAASQPAPPSLASTISPPSSTTETTPQQPEHVSNDSQSAKPAASKPKPPPVTEKPSSFRDRIAAFNKNAAPPPAPFKPSGLGSTGSGFIKKPFVAPPPSKNAYVPPPRDIPIAKVYRRDEDPEIKEDEAEIQQNAERAGLVPSQSTQTPEGGEDEPKPLSLKERLALLQKQQAEQASRHADAAAKKEKPKRPPKKRTDTGGEGEAEPIIAPPSLARRDTEDTTGRVSIDEEHPPRLPHPKRRASSKDVEARDGNEADLSGAGDTTEGPEDPTEREEVDEKARRAARAEKLAEHEAEEEGGDEEEEDEREEEEEEDIDPEVKRKEELRARMARLGGGMGMPGLFGAPMMPMPGASSQPKKKKPTERRSTDGESVASPASSAPPVPTPMALPGMSRTRTSEDHTIQEAESDQEEDATPLRTPHHESEPSFSPRESGGAPPIPGGRPAPPPVPSESRPPPIPSAASEIKSPSEGSASDDELSERTPLESESRKLEMSPTGRAPPPPPPAVATSPSTVPTSPRQSMSKRRSMAEEMSPTSPIAPSKRDSRPPPPIPGAAPAIPAQTRPPPPPPPGAAPPLSRTTTGSSRPGVPQVTEDDEEVTEYEGDYDTDIASSVPHKDALKAHQRESSFEETATPVRSPTLPPTMPPPIPQNAPRAPPPIPSQPPPPAQDSRKSVDFPRVAPPPPPPKEAPRQEDDGYDPYNYTASPQTMPAMPGFFQPAPPPPAIRHSEDTYSSEAPSYTSPPPNPRAPPPAPPPGRAAGRQSLDVSRPAAGRRSVDAGRPSSEFGFVANDLDLASQSGWWMQPNNLPPQLQGRKDIFSESDESTAPNPQRPGRTTVTRDVFILYQDYSQTVITAHFDPQDASDVQLEQRHEGPPRAPRQDQLEQSYERFGRAIGEAAQGKKDTVVGDGTPMALVHELLRPLKDALLPVGTRGFGALIYSNMANASTSQNDEIRPGDIISIRNARFQGKHGAMHAKYSMEVGKPDHVGIVAEWDGTKKKVRVWEQGRESKKVKMESFKLDDLRSGEVKIWRVMPRSWVGWEGGN